MRWWPRTMVLFLLVFLWFLQSSGFAQGGVTIRIVTDPVSSPAGAWAKGRAEAWARKTGNRIEVVDRPHSTTDTLALFQQYWAARSPDVDVYMIDVIWPGIVAPHAVDLKQYFTPQELAEHFPRIVQNNTVGGKLVGVPFFTDAGLLYYRTDLLRKYGAAKPPATWRELEQLAQRIQEGERRAGRPDFWGFVWQGQRYEGLTCNALEWINSHGGGQIVEPNGEVSVNNPNAQRALERARSWIGRITPPGVTTYQEEESRNVWQSGNAAFMRNWPYAYALGQSAGSPIRGRIGVAVLPRGEGPQGRHAATLGGWQLMVSAYSRNPKIAADLVRFMTSVETQRSNAVELSRLPTRPALYRDPAVLAKNPWFQELLPVFTNAVGRPSAVAGAKYNQVSEAFFTGVHEVLTGQKSAQVALRQIESRIRRILR